MTVRWIPIARQFASEDELRAAVLSDLYEHFTIRTEVWGTHCTGKRLRLDAVLRPRVPDGWRDAAPVLGVEFKNLGGAVSTNDFTRWAAQALDYSHVDWDGIGRMTIFTCPPVSEPLRERGGALGGAGLMAHLLAQMYVGELGRTQYGWTFARGDQLWSERYGVHRKWSLIPKTGSR